MPDLYEVVLTQTFVNQQCINRWNYLFSGTPGVSLPSFILARALGAIESGGVYDSTRLMGKLASLQNGSVVFQQLTVQNVFDPVDFYQVPFVSPLFGGRGGAAESPAIAYGFRTNVVRRDISRGYKRFVGVEKDDIASGGVIGSPSIGTMNDLAVLMTANAEDEDEGTTLTFQPCVAGKEEYDPHPGDTGPNVNHRAYRYYAVGEQFDHLATGIVWQAYSQVRTQGSRQYGRGR